jgi:hypothetical protein
MKKLFIILITLALFFAGCDNGTTTDNKTPDSGTKTTTLRIKNQSSKTLTDVLWDNITFEENSSPFVGTWKDEVKGIALEITASSWNVVIPGKFPSESFSGSWQKEGDILKLYDSNSPLPLFSASISASTLNLKNEFYGTDVHQLTKEKYQFTPSTNINKTVSSGSGYIFFKVNSTAYRTNDLVVVDTDENKEFTFTNYTVVVNVTTPGTTVTLGSL